MKTPLFPHSFQRIGWVVFAIGIALGVYAVIKGFNGSYTLNNITIISIIVGGILATCSREKIEDELTQQLRLSSLLVALYINYTALVVCALAVYDLDFLNVMIYNMFTILLIFMVVFRWKIWRLKRGGDNE